MVTCPECGGAISRYNAAKHLPCEGCQRKREHNAWEAGGAIWRREFGLNLTIDQGGQSGKVDDTLRARIFAMDAQGLSRRAIAREVGVRHTTVGYIVREVA